MFTNKKREGINTFVCAILIYVVETPKTSINEHELPLPRISFGIVAYGFVGQPFSKQLYIFIYLLCPSGYKHIFIVLRPGSKVKLFMTRTKQPQLST